MKFNLTHLSSQQYLQPGVFGFITKPRYIFQRMAPSANVEGELAPAQDIESSEKPLENGAKEQVVPATSENTTAPKGKAKTANGAQQKGKPSEGSKDGKPSGKELKEKAKAEKAARRAQQKGRQPGQQGQPIVDLGPEKQKNADTRRPSVAGPAPTTKIQHKRTGSASGGAQKPIQFRPVQAHAAPISEEPTKENKNVALSTTYTAILGGIQWQEQAKMYIRRSWHWGFRCGTM